MTDLDRILQAVGSEYGQQRHALLATSRGRKDVAHARMVAMYLATQMCPSLSLTAIGAFFGRDRTTVRHAREKVAAMGDKNVKKMEARLARAIAPVRTGE